MSAAAFAKGLLDLEGQLTPILVRKSIKWDLLFGLMCLTRLSFQGFTC